MLVQAVDGMYYQNPILFGKDWFLKFSDDDGPCIFIHAVSPDHGKTRARKILKGRGIVVSFLGTHDVSMEAFPPKFAKLVNAVYYYLKLLAPIPVPDSFTAVVSTPMIPFIAFKETVS